MKVVKAKEENIGLVVDVIKKGGVVIVPTDTVYGLICDGFNEESKRKIYELKGRDFSKPLIGFVDCIEKAQKFAEIDPNFIRNKWPGKVTVIGKSKQKIPYITSNKGKTGIRIPGYDFLLDIIKNFEIIGSTSANISGEKTPSSIEEISSELKAKVDLIVDGGKTPGRESTIWDISTYPPKLIRGKILFVCEGNSCRSPMAEYFLKNYLKDKGLKIEVISAGLSVLQPGKFTDKTIQVMKEVGIEIPDTVSKPINFKMIEEADLIFVMENFQREKIVSYAPESREKIIVLDIPDPAGKEISHYREIRDKIKEKIKNIVLKRIGI